MKGRGVERHAGKTRRYKAGITGNGGPIILGLLEIIGLFGDCLASSFHQRFVAGGGVMCGGEGTSEGGEGLKTVR